VFRVSVLLLVTALVFPFGSAHALTPTTTFLSTDLGPSVTLTAIIYGNSYPNGPTGTVDFYNGLGYLGTGTVSLNSYVNRYEAIFSTSLAAVGGNYSFVANYSGDATHSPSASLLPVWIATPNATFFIGQTVTLTATVPGNPYPNGPTGTVSFYDDGTLLNTGAVTYNSATDTYQTTFSTASLAVGTHGITASYSGDGVHIASTSWGVQRIILDQTVATTTTLTSSSTNPTVGTNFYFTATVTGISYPNGPTGTVSFYDDGTLIGTDTVTYNSSAYTYRTTIFGSSLAVGTHDITASYAGDAVHDPSTSAVLSQTVKDRATTTTALTTSNADVANGTLVTFNATVSGCANIDTGGVVSFYDGATLLGSTATIFPGVATFSTAALSPGTHSITASFSGNIYCKPGTSAPVSQTVQSGTANTMTLTSSSTNPTVGTSFYFTATVPGNPYPNGPTGTVSFYDDGTLIGTGTVTYGSSAFAYRTIIFGSSLTVGTHSITASYSGDAAHGPNTSPVLSQTVKDRATTTTALTTSNADVANGTLVTFNATVSGCANIDTGGVVSFYDGATLLGSTATIFPGVATFSTAALSPGTHSITASFSGNIYCKPGTSAVLSQTIQPSTATVPTTTTLTTSNANAEAGEMVTFIATVSGNPYPSGPTGFVSFYDDTTLLGTGTLAYNAITGTYQATFSTRLLTAGGTSGISEALLCGYANDGYTFGLDSTTGTHNITASYAGDPVHLPSTSAVLSQNVVPSGLYAISGNAGVAGATMAAGGQTVVADAAGNFTITSIITGTYILTPTKAGYTFSPSARVVSLGPDATGQSFTATAIPVLYSISGNAGISGADVVAGGQTVTSDGSGNYSITSLSAGNYTVSASKTGYTFSPVSTSVTVGPDATGINFTATVLPTYTISGNVETSGVTVSAGGVSVVSDTSGNYTITGLNAGDYTVTATLAGYVFSPSSIPVTLGPNQAGINFVVAVEGFTISGNAGIGSATVSAGGKTVISDAGGNYSIPDLVAGTYTVTAAKGEYTFVPISYAVTIGPDATGNNFTVILNTYSISGNAGNSTVTVTAGGQTATSDINGNYTITGLLAGTYTVTPTRLLYSFSPVSLVVTVGPNATGKNFTAILGYSISGNVGVEGATVTAGGETTTSDAGGNYTISGLVASSYAVTPTKSGYSFTPGSLVVTVGPNATNKDFTATVGYSISGNAGVDGATVTIGSETVTADINGDYTFSNLTSGTYTATPSKTGYTFTPPSLSVTLGPAATEQDFAAILNSTNQPVTHPTLATDVVVRATKVSGGSSGYQLVFEVDMANVTKVTAGEDDPYWWQYYRSFWDAGGNFIGAGTGNMLDNSTSGTPWTYGPAYGNLFWDDWWNEGWTTVNSSGYPFNDNNFTNDTEFDTRDIVSSRRKTTGDMRYAYFQHHFRNKIGDAYPGWSSLGPNYYPPGGFGVTLSFGIQLYEKKVYEAESATYYGAEDWVHVMAGEVKESGWAIVPTYPLDVGGGPIQWIMIKPKGESVQVRTSGSQCPLPGVLGENPTEGATPCIIDPELWVEYDGTVKFNNEGQCVDPSGSIVTAISEGTCKAVAATSPPGETFDLDELKVMDALFQQVAFGGDSVVNPSRDGYFYKVNPDGSSSLISANYAAIVANEYHIIDVNGSNNSVKAAISNAQKKASRYGSPVVLLYVAQSTNWFDLPTNQYVRDRLSELFSRTAGQGVPIALFCHSWSVHICLNETRTYTNVSRYLVNGARIPGSSLDDQFINDIRDAHGTTTLLGGTDDDLSKAGNGQYYYDADIGAEVNSELANAASSNNNGTVVQYLISGANHGQQSMMERGAYDAPYVTIP